MFPGSGGCEFDVHRFGAAIDSTRRSSGTSEKAKPEGEDLKRAAATTDRNSDQYLPKASATFWPPKPNELLIAYW